MDTLIELARGLFEIGWEIDAVRKELRSTILDCGDSPTCGAVEEAMAVARKGKI